jgi:hypothetical protein
MGLIRVPSSEVELTSNPFSSTRYLHKSSCPRAIVSQHRKVEQVPGFRPFVPTHSPQVHTTRPFNFYQKQAGNNGDDRSSNSMHST